ncbi:hypothetical protein SAMN02745165_00808 [Malonomonas rubra DSM 5091]|uniref:PKD domain-containing protein n=1 Tax=Malonomonas rubra DSM 5091 TaxID=1122189 RepID=A0A1M6DUB5_MALRU|nr:PKD domain-containing protein [Malonomonas rubra]SHI76791.1 hypothetical protein SAMN02745165_00808 [Malonomonas rubra DSM 5091]
MARLFEGASGTSAYNAAAGKFDEVDSTRDPATTYWYVPFDYGSEAEFLKKVDLSLAGNMMDCGECHVGGGMMEYIPYKDTLPQTNDYESRVSLRTISTTGFYGFGGDPLVANPITAADYTAFNYFIDTYDVDNDGDKTEALHMDYIKTGVMEMDCLLCHLPGYKYDERREALRDAKIDASRAIGAGLGTDNGLTWADGAAPPAGYGTTVVYDMSQFIIDGNGNLRIPKAWMDENVAPTPDSTNCSFCHMNEFSVDWKKRGDHWAPNGQYDFQYEVHYNFGCMGCHERKPTALQPDDPNEPNLLPDGVTANPAAEYTSVWGGPYPEMGDGLLGHDPAKGDSQYSGLYNKNDKAAFKQCQDCHINGAGGREYGAPNPTMSHAAAGLTAKIAQGNTADGVAKISHIDMMHCTACHTRKANSYDWGNTGNPLIDATGKDAANRLTDHENPYVMKQNMTDNTSLAWYKGKIHRVSSSATMFWRDKNDTPALDANFDGRPHGMDALLMTDVLAVNEDNGWASITEDHHGDVTPADFGERITAFNSYIENKAGVAAGTAKTKFSIFHVNFMNNHGVSPIELSWGINGCTDCHDAGANFYNGSIDTTGDNNTMVYGASTSQRVPFTKVNGFSQPTDWHPGQMDKFGVRTIAIQISNTPTTWDDDGNAVTPEVAALTTRPVERSENMYEAAFMGKADFADEYEGGTIDLSGYEKGWLLMVEVEDESDGSVATYTKSVGTDVTDMAGLMGQISSQFKDGTFGFVVALNTAGDGIKITAEPGYNVRLQGGIDNSASFALSNAAYKATPWIGVDGTVANGRSEWVAYLDGIDENDLPAHGVADAGADLVAEVSVPVTLAANEVVNAGVPSISYSWICNDLADTVYEGASIEKTFDTVGTYTCNLRVEDAYGDIHQDAVQVQVTAPAPAADIAVVTSNPAGTGNTVRFSNLPATYTMLYIIWGDGSREKVYPTGSPASVDVDHTFSASSRYFVGPDYRYLSTVYVYNGGARIDINREYLFIAP